MGYIFMKEGINIMISFIKKGLLILGAISVFASIPAKAVVYELYEAEREAVKSSSVKGNIENIFPLSY